MILSLAPRSHRRTPIAGLVALVALVAALVVAATVTRAHKAITSKYTYNEDIYPIVRAHCGACHVDGGIAPMSLMTYNDAYPWAESIKEEIISLRMPPWHAEEGFGAFRHVQTLGARELDILMEWSLGWYAGRRPSEPARARGLVRRVVARPTRSGARRRRRRRAAG